MTESLDGRTEVSLEMIEREEVSVFETLRTYGRRIFHLEEHLDRLFASAQTCGLEIPASRDELKARLERAVERFAGRKSFFRLTVTPRDVLIIATKREYPPETFTRGVSLWTSTSKKSLSQSVPREAKSSCYGPEILAGFGAPPGTFEVLLLSEEGYVREARVSNIFMIKGKRCITPPVCGILDGVTRKFVIALAKASGLAVREDNFTRHDLYNADEVFLTNTSGEIVPVREIDGRMIRGKVPGAWTLRLRREFRKKTPKAGRKLNPSRAFKESENGVKCRESHRSINRSRVRRRVRAGRGTRSGKFIR